MRAAVVAACLLVPTIATAQPTAYAPPASEYTAPPPPVSSDGQSEDRHYSRPSTATALAIGWSAIGIGTMILGAKMRDGGDTPIMVLGGAVTLAMPSAGHWWADGGLRFTPGLGLRLVGMTMMGVGFGSALDRNCSAGDQTCQVPIHDGTSDALVVGGAAVVLGGVIYDIATAGREAAAHNARIGRHSYGVGPTMVQTAHGTSPAVSVSGAF